MVCKNSLPFWQIIRVTFSHLLAYGMQEQLAFLANYKGNFLAFACLWYARTAAFLADYKVTFSHLLAYGMQEQLAFLADYKGNFLAFACLWYARTACLSGRL
ncbi:hypothetical protein CDAR_127871 [Caerostris darwini]|uniref:Uncharacterized protein n=1 Tax=Caerostris darwini TaxID=1538125 RepID=A0AAV4R383_9ARAC|nr:hypothetical protein CDAR_127871 [Caerostris darwini]